MLADTRKSHEEGLDQDFNSLDAQRAAAEAYVQSQVHEGWKLLPARYVDGGFSGGNMDRPALNALIDDIRAGKIDCVVVYKVDRLSRSLLDFSRLIALFDEYQVSFVSVTQQFNTTTSMGRLTLNILLSFAQFEREIIGERIRDKKLLTARQGKYIGGQPKLGLDIVDRKYVINPEEAKLVRRIFRMATQMQSCQKTADTLNGEGICSKVYNTKTGKTFGGNLYSGRSVYNILTDAKYIGQIVHNGVSYQAEHQAIIAENLETTFAVSDGKITVRRDGGKVVVSVPVRFYRRSGRQMILADSIESDSIEAAVPNNALLTALAKAYAW
ncbi:MAG: recombinase family protein [Planctomycetota bacterium]